MTEPDRTSPAANTPERLVSSRKGWRPDVQCGEAATSAPVRTNPFSSLSISSGSQPTSYYQPTAKLWVPLSKGATWFSEWRYYGYGDAFEPVRHDLRHDRHHRPRRRQ